MRSRTQVLLLCVALWGCNPVKYNTMNAPPHPTVSRSPESVELYSVDPPARPFVEVALLQREMGSLEGDAHALKLIREVAAEKGCDALWLNPTREHIVAFISTESVTVLPFRTKQAVCLVYYGDGEAPPVSPERQIVPDAAASEPRQQAPATSVDLVPAGR